MRSFQWKLYLYSFFNQLLLIYPVYSILFSDNGLSYTKISALLIIWSGTAILFEIPLGIIGDIFKRKHVLLLGSLTKLLTFIVWLFFPTFEGFAFGFFLWGISGSLTSGTLEAFLFDELKVRGKSSLYEQINGNLNAFKYMGVAFSLLIGGFIAEISYDLVLYLTLLSIIISAVILLSVRQRSLISNAGDSGLRIFKNALIEIKSNKKLMLLILILALLLGIYGAFDEFNALLYYEIGFSKSIIGFLGFIDYSVYALGGFIVGKGFNKKLPLWVVPFFGAISFIFFYLIESNLLIPSIFILSFLYAIGEIRLVSKIQEYIKSDSRATILSISNMLTEIIGLIVLLILGFGADLGIWNTVLITGGLLIIPLILIVYYSRINAEEL